MPITNEIDFVDPSEINIGPRQRKEAKIEGLIDSIKARGIWNPIIVHRERLERLDKLTLIAGHRRLLCALELKLTQVPIRYYDTLDPHELQIIELEENIKRENLSWRDHTNAIGNFHKNKLSTDKSWTSLKTAEALNYTPQQINNTLNVFYNLDSPLLSNADNFTQALGILQRKEERRAADLVEELLRAPSQVQAPTQELDDLIIEDILNTSDEETLTELKQEGLDPEVIAANTRSIIENVINKTKQQTLPIINIDFNSWSKNYSASKFNLIHCDFTSENTYAFGNPINSFVDNFNRFISYSAHIMIWLDLNIAAYEGFKETFTEIGFSVINRPLIWFKSDTTNGAPGVWGTEPKSSYEVCLLASRGNRGLFKQVTDCYAAPQVISPFVPNQKPESMLKHFLSMLIDNATDFLDIGSGSGSAIRAAEFLGARSVLGIEINESYTTKANELTLNERAKRKASEALR